MANSEKTSIQKILGLDPEEVLSVARNFTVDDLRKLIYRLESIADDLKRDIGSEIWEDTLPSALSGVKSAYQDRVRNNFAMLQAGEITKTEFMKDMHDAVSSGFTDSYQLGKGAKILSAGDEEWIKRATGEELGYASDLADRLMDEDLPDIDIDSRAASYTRTLDSVGWQGKIESLPEDTEIHWKLGKAEHCEDCIILNSNNPYTKDSLPTTPRAGATQCYTNCKCTLVFKKGALKQTDALDASDRERLQGQTLNDFLKPNPPPKGLRIPTNIERGEIDRITAEMNYYRRLIGTGELEGEALEDAIKARSRLNGTLIDYTEERGIWDVPLMSVDEVITEAQFPLSAESQLFMEYGLDGATLDLTTAKNIEKLVAQYEKEYGKSFTDVKKDYSKPDIKSKKARKK